jgi:preprotein translocase subunit SecD
VFDSIRNRLILIALLAAASLWTLRPRSVIEPITRPDGVTVDSQVTRWGPNLGLDLQGGMHLGLELDQSTMVSTDPKRDIDLALTILRKRTDEFGVAEPVIQKSGDDRIVVELPGTKDPARARAIVQKSAFLEFRITDKTQALDRSLPAMDRAVRALGIGAAPGAPAAAPSAVTKLLGGDSTGADTGAVVAGVLSSLIKPAGGAGFTAMPGEYMVPVGAVARVDSLLALPSVARELPRGLTVRWAAESVSIGVEPFRLLYVLEDKPIMTGEHLEKAAAQIDPLTSGSIVTFELDRRGGRDFGRATGEHVGDYMAILLDGKVQGRPPVIQSRIDRRGQITLGNKPIAEAQDLALTLNAGALPVPLKVVEQFEVGSSLGSDSISGGITAGLVGTLLVVLIMVGYYRLSGLLAVGGLLLYILFSLGALTALGATLTMPGLAGIVLSIGIAVDANVLIFERIREELDHGRNVRVAIDEGFRHAMNAIIDSNVTTVLTALFLFQFGTGPVKGFAVTLSLGIAASMVTAIFVVRTFYMIWLKRKPAMAGLSI